MTGVLVGMGLWFPMDHLMRCDPGCVNMYRLLCTGPEGEGEKIRLSLGLQTMAFKLVSHDENQQNEETCVLLTFLEILGGVFINFWIL